MRMSAYPDLVQIRISIAGIAHRCTVACDRATAMSYW